MSHTTRGYTIKVLDHGFIKLVDWMGSDEAIVEAARMSTGRGFASWEPYRRCRGCDYVEAVPSAMQIKSFECGIVEPFYCARKQGDTCSSCRELLRCGYCFLGYSDMAHLHDRLVQTSWRNGLEAEHVERAVKMLGGVSE